MKRCLYTVNVGGVLKTHPRESFLDAARRWTCDYIEVIQPHGNHHPCCAKLSGALKLNGYDEVAYVDADVLISDHAPRVFDSLQSGTQLMVVADGQQQTISEWWKDVVYKAPIERCIQVSGWAWRGTMETFFNTGVMVFRNTYAVREMFFSALRKLPEQSTAHEEQAMINLCAWSKLSPLIIPNKWNYIVPPQGPSNDAFINHFAGDAKPLMDSVQWRTPCAV